MIPRPGDIVLVADSTFPDKWRVETVYGEIAHCTRIEDHMESHFLRDTLTVVERHPGGAGS